MPKFRNPNGYGTVIKLFGNRRRPWACRKTIGFNEKGHPIYKYLSYHATKREAIAALREYNADPDNLNQKTFAEVYQMWYSYKDFSDNVGNKYKNAFKRAEPLHKYNMNELTLPVIQIFFDKLETTQANLTNMKSLLNGMIEYSVKRGLLPMSAMEIMKLVDAVPKEETHSSPKKVFTQDEIEKLWEDCENVHKRYMLFYIYTGLRYSELQNAEWHDDYLNIGKAKTQAGIRMVPLSDKAKSLLPLPELKSYSDYYRVLKYQHGHMPHDTRHTFISLMTEAGVDSRIIKKIVGHKADDLTEDVYTHISLDTMLEAVNKI